MNNLWTVIKFTFLIRFKSKSFLWTTAIFAAILSLLIHLPGIIDRVAGDDEHETRKLGLIAGQYAEAAQLLDHYYASQKEPDYDIVKVPEQGSADANERKAKDMMENEGLSGYIVFGKTDGEGFPKVTYKSEDSMAFGSQDDLKNDISIIKQKLALKEAKLSEEQFQRLFAPIHFDTMQISTADTGSAEGKTESEMAMAYALVYVLLFMIYMVVLGYGNMVAMEITSEKNGRVMEVLISSVAPLKQMFGKIIGICLLGLVQIAVFISVGAVNLYLSDNKELLDKIDIDLNDLPIELLSYFIIFYLMAYLLFSTVFAAVGSLVSRTEEVGQAIMPVTLLIVAVFMVAMFGLNSPDAFFIKVMSFIPFFTPLVMFLRIGMSDPQLWEIWLAIGINIGAIVLLGWLAAKIYRVGVLLYGKRPGFKELRKALKAYKV